MSGGMQAENGFEIGNGYQYYCGHASFGLLVPFDPMAAILSCIALHRSALARSTVLCICQHSYHLCPHS
jgi:hypothetical protein